MNWPAPTPRVQPHGENLFWMGRYTERCEQQLRLLQTIKDLPSGDDKPHDSVLQAVSELADHHGLVPHRHTHLMQAPRVFERALLDALSDAQTKQGPIAWPTTYRHSIVSAQILRDRLSAEHARWLRALGPNSLSRWIGRRKTHPPEWRLSIRSSQRWIDWGCNSLP